MLEKLFISVLNMSLISSYVIIFVLLARILLKKTPKIFSYALWGIVLFRLLCPFSFESAISLMPMESAPISQDIIYSPAPQINTGIAAFDSVVNSMLPAPNIGDSANPIQILLFIGAVIWALGMVIMVIYSVVSFVKLKQSLIGAAPFKANIYLADHISSPFVMGLFKPKIYLPSSLTDTEKDFIIDHETCHVKRLDHVTRILGFTTLAIHWFNPLVWLAFILSGKDMELSCDEAVMKRMSTDIRAEYSQSLLRFGTVKRVIHATPLAFGEGDTKSRVKNVLNYKKPAFWVVVIAIIAVVGIGIGLTANQKSNPILTPESNEVASISVEQIDEGESLGVIETADKSQIETILKALQTTNKTMRESVNDSPKRDDYFKIDINGSNSRRFYLYNDGEKYFVEEPYVGIYKTSRETSVSIAKIYTDNGGADTKNENELWAMRPMIMVEGVLYLDTGKEVSGNVDSAVLGEIASSAGASEKPIENGQCNFDSGVGARYATYNDGIAVFLDNKWYFFEKETNIAEKLTHDQAVASALFSLSNQYLAGECIAEGHIILGYDDNDKNKTNIYALTTIGHYGFENDNFVQVSGSAFPAVITLNSDNSVSIQQPLDGSDYAKSIKKMFPKEYHDRVFDYEDSDRENLKQQEEKYAKEYLSKNGRDAKIGAYSDFEYTSLTDLGVSVEVSNNLQVFYKQHNYYPSFIGTRERIESGTRMVYEMSYHENEDEIRFVKYDYGTKRILEQFVADAKTGNVV